MNYKNLFLVILILISIITISFSTTVHYTVQEVRYNLVKYCNNNNIYLNYHNYNLFFYQVLPSLVKVANDFNFNINIFLSIIEVESSFKYVIGDNGKAIGYGQLHLNTAWFVISKYKDYLVNKLHMNIKVKSTKDLISTPVRTSILSFLWLIYNYQHNKNILVAIKRYNGINNSQYLVKVVNVYFKLDNVN